MRRYEYAVMLCLLWLACVIMSGDIGMALLTSVGEPLLGPFINVMVSLNYIDARDLSFEYMGRDELDRKKQKKQNGIMPCMSFMIKSSGLLL